MNTLSRSLLASLALVALVGCASNRSPLQPASVSPVTGGHGLLLAGSSAVGAGAGAALMPKNRVLGAAAGGAVGLITGALIGNHNSNEAALADAEAYERGKRDARVETMKKYWQDQTLSPESDSDKPSGPSASRPIDYPAGTYDGIKFGPRTTSAPALDEPRR